MFYRSPRASLILLGLAFLVALGSGAVYYANQWLNGAQAIQTLRQELAAVEADNVIIKASVKALTDLPKLTRQTVSLGDVLNPAQKIKAVGTKAQTAVSNAKQAVPNLKQAYPDCLKHLAVYTSRAAGMRNSTLDEAGLPRSNQVTCGSIPPDIMKALKLTS